MAEISSVKVGDKITFASEKRAYTVQAATKRFIVCTKPFNARKTVLYTVIDLDRNVRGTENLIFGMGAETREDCEEMAQRLQSGHTEVSYRNFVQLDVVAIRRQP